MKIQPAQTLHPDLEPLLVQLNGKRQGEWTIEDWKLWANYLDKQAEYFKEEAMRLLGDNLQLESAYRHLEDWARKRLGLPKQRKIKGLLVRPRGRPINHVRKEQQLERGKALLAAGKSWREVTEIFSREGLGSDQRTIKRMLKTPV